MPGSLGSSSSDSDFIDETPKTEPIKAKAKKKVPASVGPTDTSGPSPPLAIESPAVVENPLDTRVANLLIREELVESKEKNQAL